MAWGIPTIQRIVVGSTHKPDPAGTQQVHREEDHSTTRGVLSSLELSIFLFDLSIMEKEKTVDPQKTYLKTLVEKKRNRNKISYSEFLSTKRDIVSELNNIFGY